MLFSLTGSVRYQWQKSHRQGPPNRCSHCSPCSTISKPELHCSPFARFVHSSRVKSVGSFRTYSIYFFQKVELMRVSSMNSSRNSSTKTSSSRSTLRSSHPSTVLRSNESYDEFKRSRSIYRRLSNSIEKKFLRQNSTGLVKR